jgi:osmotically-inducible protein OsmY
MLQQADLRDRAANRELERRVVNYLISRHIPGVRWLEVEADQGVVTISGKVKSYYQKQLCSHCTRRVAGVVQLVDGIEVVSSDN